MSILIGPMKQHIPGHKELTDHKEILAIKDSALIYIPLANGGSTNVEVLVKTGDKVKVGTKVAVRNDNFTVPLFSSVSGKVVGVEKLLHSSNKQVDHLIIENDFQYDKEQAVMPVDINTTDRETLIDLTMNAGIVGCGGAGFPTYIKYKSAKDIHTILINGVECEPYITADYKEMSHHFDHLILGVEAMLKMAEAKKAVIAIKKDKGRLIDDLKNALKDKSQIEVVGVPNQYPMGWERTVVFEVFKKRYDRLPAEVGIIVNNATTAIQLGLAISQGEPIVEKVITVSGDGIKNPQNVLVPVGTKVKDIISKLAGYTSDDVLLINGGPMMGRTMPHEDFVITPYTNAITVLKTQKFTTLACLRCGKCSEYCPAGLQPVRINQMLAANNYEQLEKLVPQECIECGMCTFVCPSRIEVTEGVRRAKAALTSRS